MPRPTDKPAWTQGNTTVQAQPSSGKKLAGFSPNERPLPSTFNWIFGNFSDWIDWLDICTSKSTGFDAVVGSLPNCTHADLNAVMADSAIPQGAKINVVTDLNPTLTQQITKNNCEIIFRPGVNFNFASSATTGLQLSAAGIRIRGGRFVNWTTQAILIDAGSNYCFIVENRFVNNAVDVTDNNGKAVQASNITEY